MAFREFMGSAGVEWTVYDVVPRAVERRKGDRREGDPEGGTPGEDRRVDDRRAAVRTSRPVRLTRAWLCFESEVDRRRLQPIPENWHLLPEAELVALLGQARSAPRRKEQDQEQAQDEDVRRRA